MKANLAKLSKIPLIVRVVSLYVCFGLAGWGGFVLTEVPTLTYTPPVAKPQPAVYLRSSVSGKPVTILVPRLGIELSIIDGAYDKASDSWTLTDDKAQFATITDRPNDGGGNTFIYGHNTDRVFGRLAGLVDGDIVQIKTDNNHTFSYTYSGQQIVQPTNTSVLADDSAKPRLTLMTCEGWLSQTRRIMYFDFKEVS